MTALVILKLETLRTVLINFAYFSLAYAALIALGIGTLAALAYSLGALIS